MSLEAKIREELKSKGILLMTHLVLGYPSFEENRRTIAAMAEAGVELIELQIPFSEPSADGPVIVKANAESLERGTRVSECLVFAKEIAAEFPQTCFLFMTYYNILFKAGESNFLDAAKSAGIQALIIPDLPVEEAESLIQGCRERGLSNILIFTPTHREDRLKELAAKAEGFIYSVGRKGITGQKTDFGQEMTAQIERYREATDLPLALGFGVSSKEDVDFLVGKVDIAVIGTKMIQVHRSSGAKGVGEFLSQLR